MLRYLVVAVALLNLALVGCGGGPVTVPVSGTVKVDGQPVEMGVISFTPADGKGPSEEGIITNGSYKTSVIAGSKKVAVRAQKKFGQRKAYAEDPKSPMVDDIRPLKLEDRAANLTFDVPASGGEYNPPDDLKTVK